MYVCIHVVTVVSRIRSSVLCVGYRVGFIYVYIYIYTVSDWKSGRGREVLGLEYIRICKYVYVHMHILIININMYG